MNEINKTNLSEQRKCRLKEINGMENYFHQEINKIKSCSKKLSKYVVVLSATSSGVCIISSASVAGAPVGIASVIFTLIFLKNRNNQKIAKHNKKQKEKAL